MVEFQYTILFKHFNVFNMILLQPDA